VTSVTDNTLTLTHGSCSFTPAGNRRRNVDATGVAVRLATSFAYRRVHDGRDDSSSDWDSKLCGPIAELFVDGHVVYTNSDVIFRNVGTVSGFVDLTLPVGTHSVELKFAASHHCHGISIKTDAVHIEAVVLADNVALQSNSGGSTLLK